MMSASGTGYKRLVIDAHLALPIVWAPEAEYFAGSSRRAFQYRLLSYDKTMYGEKNRCDPHAKRVNGINLGETCT